MNKIKKYIISGLFISVLFFGSTLFAKNVFAEDVVPPADQSTPASDPIPPTDPTPTPQESVSFTLRSGNQTVFSGDLALPSDGQTTLTDSDGADHSVNSKSVLAMLAQADAESDAFNISNLTYYSSFSSFYLKCITSSEEECDNWQYVVNDAYSQAGMDQNILKANDVVFIYFGSPHRVSLAKSSVFAGETFLATAQNYDYKNDSWLPLSGVTIGVTQDDPEDPWTPKEISTKVVDQDGKADFILDTEGDYKVGIKEDYYFPVENISVVPPTVSLTLRSGGNVIFSGDIPLPADGQVNLKDNAGADHSVNSRSALNMIAQADAESDSFNISDLAYYDSFGSFYLKCINSIKDECDNWQYVVNDAYSQIGIDKLDLKAGDTLYLYYGSAHQVVLSKNSIETDEIFSATAQNYDYKNGAWLPLTGVTVGVVQDDPENPWTPKEISTILVDADGTASFSVSIAGDYKIGIKEDYYFPTQNLTISNPVVTTTGGCGSCDSVTTLASFDISKATSFLISKQSDDGSFGGSALYTDWAGVALGSISGYDAEKNKLKNYFISNTNPGSNLSDYERRAMALMSLGINPYSGTLINYIQKIIDGYDGNQFGDVGLYNDDIFALIVLRNAGYSADDAMSLSSANFIISKQKSDGSWDSVDMTSAGIQALLPIGSSDGAQAVSKAKQFLLNNQRTDGGFDNVFSTGWAMQAISALGEDPNNWAKGQNTPSAYLASKQATDGSLNADGGENAVLWATEYSIPASLGKKWSEIMVTFSKPVVNASTGGGNNIDTSEKKVDDALVDKKVEDVKKEEVKEKTGDEKIAEGEDLPKEKMLTSVEPAPKQIKKNLDQKIKAVVKTEKAIVKEISKTDTNKLLTASAVDALGQNANDSGKTNIFKSAIKYIGSFFSKIFSWF